MLSYLDTRYLVLSISFSNISVSTRPILEKQSNQLIRGNAKVSKDFAEENWDMFLCAKTLLKWLTLYKSSWKFWQVCVGNL